MNLLSARKLNSRFNMMTINEVSLNWPKVFPDLLRHLLILQVETLPYRREILRWDSLSLLWIPVSEWVPGVRSFSVIILLNHLPQEIQIFHLFGLPGLLLHSVFWDMCLMHLTFSNPKTLPRTKHVLEGFSKSSFILRFPVCQEVLVISQTAMAFHGIRLRLIIQSRLQ